MVGYKSWEYILNGVNKRKIYVRYGKLNAIEKFQKFPIYFHCIITYL